MSTETTDAASKPDEAPLARPRAVNIAIAATVVRAAIWVSVAVPLATWNLKVIREKNPTDTRLAEHINTQGVLTVSVLVAAIMILLATQVYKGKSWARWLLIITTIFPKIDLLSFFVLFQNNCPAGIKLSLTALSATSIMTVGLLAFGPAAEWFRSMAPEKPATGGFGGLFGKAGAMAAPQLASDTDVSNAIRRRAPKPKSRKAPAEEV